MGFEPIGAYIGPYCYSLYRAKTGESRRFHFPVQSAFQKQFGDAQFVMEGDVSVVWSAGGPTGTELSSGSDFAFAPHIRPTPAVQEDMTLSALTDCALVCVTVSGSGERLHFDRRRLPVGESLAVPRYSLVAVSGRDAAIRVDGAAEQHGPRLLYARRGDLAISSLSPCTFGIFSLQP